MKFIFNFADMNSKDNIQVDFMLILPQEIVVEILHHLDMASIFNCFTVSKGWRDVITNLNVKAKLHWNWMCGVPRVYQRKSFILNFIKHCKGSYEP